MFFYANFRKDDLLFHSFQYYLTGFLEVLFIFSVRYLENPFILCWLAFAGIPLLDFLTPPDIRNPSKEEARRLSKELRFKIPVYVAVLVDWITEFWVINWLIQNDTKQSPIIIIATILMIGLLGGLNINISHELVHKEDTFERGLGIFNLGRMFYMHWYVEHVWGHHKRVGLKDDPATARYNETLYQFIPRCVAGTWKSAWNIEKDRLLKQKGYKSVWVPQNKFIYFVASYIAFPLLVAYFLGVRAGFYFVMIGIVSFLFLEIINYIEHYGLIRNEDEKVTIQHSWNAPHRLSNIILFKLQRHSDHHENAHKPYQVLCSYEESPTMPQGYAGMIILALFPNSFRKVMNQLLDHHGGIKKLEKTNFDKLQQSVDFFVFKVAALLTLVLILSLCLQNYNNIYIIITEAGQLVAQNI
eukprot:TRINITY_DN923_c0_g1_i1.p1 TRINITY_DN923_c0_g1~~TRINITY_DN923_c0_g1_i1.p1  ORF type:complete len:414 (-),score=87.93 TRINITY_DN923_c0_g1_i1:458-1699(-)